MIKIIYKAYDRDLHRYLRDDEVRIAPSGQVWYNNSEVGQIWEPLSDSAEWLVIEKVITTEKS